MGAMTTTGNRLLAAGVLAGAVFAAGLIGVMQIPGGGDVTDHQFISFYSSSSKRVMVLGLGLALIVGTWLMVWLFTELRRRFGSSTRADLSYRLACIGATAVMVGGAVDAGPAGVQDNSNSPFVGIPVAHAFAQAGLGVLVAGLACFAVAIFLTGLEMRASAAFPSWLGVLSVVFAALLLIGSYIVAPGLLLPIWAMVVGVASRRMSPVIEEGRREPALV